MGSYHDHLFLGRRRFLTSTASGLGSLALASLLRQDSPLAKESSPPGPLASKTPHLPARAKNCIFIFLAGGTSQIELFDPKPKLHDLTGQKLPDSFFKNERFSFIKPEQSLLMGSHFPYRHYGQCGMEMSELLPHVGSCADQITLIRSMYTDQFDHAPAEILFSTGTETPGNDEMNGPFGPSTPGLVPPRIIPSSRALPQYPPAARRAGLLGTVILMVVIEEDGQVGEIQVLRSPDQRWGFDLSAIDAVKQWRYEPALMNGRAVAAYITVMVEFTLSR